MIDGRLSRPMAMTVPGMFLSPPGRATSASYHWAPMIVSIESAMRSRDWSEKLMPSVPIEMPSLTPTVLKRIPTSPTSSQPRLTWVLRSARCMLHGLPSYQTLPMPICGLARSSQESPVAMSIACDAPWLAGCVMGAEYLLRPVVGRWVAVGMVDCTMKHPAIRDITATSRLALPSCSDGTGGRSPAGGAAAWLHSYYPYDPDDLHWRPARRLG